MMLTRLGRLAPAVAAAAFLAACADQPTPMGPSALAPGAAFDVSAAAAGEGELRICKAGNAAGTFSFDWTVVNAADASVVASGTGLQVAVGACVTAVQFPTSGSSRLRATVTETTTLANWALTSLTAVNSAGTPVGWPVPVIDLAARTASNIGMANDVGAEVTFTNTYTPPPPPPPPSLQGRMTGGGAQIFGDVRITRGFTIHCDIVLSNNLEINWGKNQWHIAKPLTSATCLDDPAYREQPPVAPFNTFIGEGTGRLNGVDGSKVYFTFIDAGEPGKNDKAAIKIIAPDGVTVVLDIPLSLLDHGNIQAHYDQPHGQKKP